MIDKPSILRRTNYGIRLYTHAIRERWPDEMAMKISGDDCGICRNPLTEDGPRTLHIWVEKLPSEQRLPDRIARHHDEIGFVADGDCFDFAERYYGKSGQELLDYLNSELNLHLEPGWNPYSSHLTPQLAKLSDEGPRCSFFRAPIGNVTPEREVTLAEVYTYIVGDQAYERTAKLRSISDPKEARRYNALHFDYITASGTFTSRKDECLVQHSGIMTIDIDKIDNVDDLFDRLLQDEYLETALLFRSPSGNGLKWRVSVDLNGFTHAQYFQGISGYIHQTYGILIDQSGKDVSRACFLAHDERAYLNPQFS